MKQLYGNIELAKGMHRGGLCAIQVIPREWLADEITPDFSDGIVKGLLPLQSGKFWMGLQFTPTTYYFQEDPKQSKSGDFYAIACGGVLNTFGPQAQQYLSSMNKSDLVAIITTKNKKSKIIGNTDFGLKLSISHIISNNPNEQRVKIDLSGEFEELSPFYQSSLFGNYLQDSDGNFILDSDGNLILVD